MFYRSERLYLDFIAGFDITLAGIPRGICDVEGAGTGVSTRGTLTLWLDVYAEQNAVRPQTTLTSTTQQLSVVCFVDTFPRPTSYI